MRKEIRVGSTVRPKSGGPDMKVEIVFLKWNGGQVRCNWTNGTKKISQMFDLEEVEQTSELVRCPGHQSVVPGVYYPTSD